MKVKVTEDNVVITECSCINEGEVCVNECVFVLPPCFDGLSVTAAFNNIPVPVLNNRCNVPSLKKGTAVLGVYAYKENDEGIELMYSPKPTSFFVNQGSYSEDVGVEKIPTISEFEQFCKSYSQEILKEIEGLGVSGSGSGVSEAQRQTLLAVVNAIGLFNVPNAQTLLDNFNKAWNTVEPIPATSITLDKKEITFTAEKTQTIVASVLPSNTTDVVVWKSSNSSVATVKNGIVTPLNDGETVITATAGNVFATCAVTVNMFGEIENPVFVYQGKVSIDSTATSDPVFSENYPNSVAFSAIPVKNGDTFTLVTSLSNPVNWVRFYQYDTDGLNAKEIYYKSGNTYTKATQDGFIRVEILKHGDEPYDLNTLVSEISVTNNGEKTIYNIVDRR